MTYRTENFETWFGEMQELRENWKCRRDSVWQVQVDTVMINIELIKDKQKKIALIAAQSTKCHKLEEQQQTTRAALKEKVSTLENQLTST